VSKPAIVVQGVSKRFRIYKRAADLVWELLTGRIRHREFTALDAVTFSIARGEIVGIIGRNGAGKSTLLKIIAEMLEPSAGRVEVNGRISAILELGSGFNPEYTGRENIYIGGLCLGLRREDIRAREADIIAFSELEAFIDQPFKTYSSGMQARLTFSVAVSINPDILIVDEALSVGDAKFQRKCLRKFEDFRASGATVLFVTHQSGMVEAICNRAIYLASGAVAFDGPPGEAVAQYFQDLFGQEKEATCPGKSPAVEEQAKAIEARRPPEKVERRYGTGEVTITHWGLHDEGGAPTSICLSGATYRLFCDAHCNVESIEDLQIGIGVCTRTGIVLAAHNSAKHRVRLPPMRKGDIVRVTLDVNMNLGPGDYFVTFGAWSLHAERHYDRRVDAFHFSVRAEPGLEQSLVNLRPRYSATKLMVETA